MAGVPLPIPKSSTFHSFIKISLLLSSLPFIRVAAGWPACPNYQTPTSPFIWEEVYPWLVLDFDEVENNPEMKARFAPTLDLLIASFEEAGDRLMAIDSNMSLESSLHRFRDFEIFAVWVIAIQFSSSEFWS